MRIKINITPMSMGNGVLGLPIACCREWDAYKGIEGFFEYAGKKQKSPFHRNI